MSELLQLLETGGDVGPYLLLLAIYKLDRRLLAVEARLASKF
ncbi:hypothetical protein [Pseudoteredinibacter isoporae]